MTDSNQTGDQVLALGRRIKAASASVDIREFIVYLIEDEGIDPEVAWLAWGCAQVGKND